MSSLVFIHKTDHFYICKNNTFEIGMKYNGLAIKFILPMPICEDGQKCCMIRQTLFFELLLA
jgi:hypothetical protein